MRVFSTILFSSFKLLALKFNPETDITWRQMAFDILLPLLSISTHSLSHKWYMLENSDSCIGTRYNLYTWLKACLTPYRNHTNYTVIPAAKLKDYALISMWHMARFSINSINFKVQILCLTNPITPRPFLLGQHLKPNTRVIWIICYAYPCPLWHINHLLFHLRGL